MKRSPALVFDDLAMAYGGRILFRDLNLEVLPGQVIGIEGPSGSGKSTLLKLAAGLLRPSGGRVTVNAPILGYVFQEPRLLPWFTALENIGLVLEAKGVPKNAAREAAGKSLERMGLYPFRHHYPGQLSGGMNQRVSIARALAVAPDLLLLDEPFTGLDPALKTKVRDQVSTMAVSTRTAVLHVTHARDELLEQTSSLCSLVPDKGGARLIDHVDFP